MMALTLMAASLKHDCMAPKSLDLSVDLVGEESSYLFGRRPGEPGYGYHHQDNDRCTAKRGGSEREQGIHQRHESPEQRLRESDQKPGEHPRDHPMPVRTTPPDPEQKGGEDGVSG